MSSLVRWFMLSLALLASAIVACSQEAPSADAAPADSIATVDGVRVRLTASAWRDFMPSVPARGHGSDLMVSIQVVAVDSAPLPAGLAVDSVWVRSGNDVWATSPSPEPRPKIPNGVDLMLRGGPKWEPGRALDILLRLRPSSGAPLHLRTRNVVIERVS